MKRSLLQHGKFPFKLLLFMIAFRLLDLLLINSSYVPDEYWQSLEVSHKQVFGYGHITWEWTKGIRSYVYVMIVSGIYSILKFCQLDSVELVVLAPRLIQALISAIADVYFVRWIYEKRNGQYSWALLSWLTCYFISYCSTRTLINTFEMNLTTIALFYYPWSPKSKSTLFVSLVSLLCYVRPTAAIIWFPLICINLSSMKDPMKFFITRYLPVSIFIGAICFAIDSLFHETYVITPYNFFLYNVIMNVGAHYGSQPFYWYLFLGLPAVLGVHIVPLLIGSFQLIKKSKLLSKRIYYDIDCQMLLTVVWSLSLLSFVQHKEFRFLMPLIPMCLFVSSGVLSRWSTYAKTIWLYILGILLITVNFSTVIYLGQFHNVGGLETVRYLSGVAKNVSNSKFLFLTPCHSLPMYSHLHANVRTDFLTCLPNFDNYSNYKDESDLFFDNPRQFLRDKYSKSLPCSLPSHIITYDSLNITNFLHINNYDLIKQTFNSYLFPARTGQYINVYKRKGEVCN